MKQLAPYVLHLSFLVALVSMLGSLYISEIMAFPPCILCWYQRICMYPLVFVFAAALVSNDTDWRKYSFPLIGTGLAIALYHNLLYYGIIPEHIKPCEQGVSCTSRQVEILGFLTIPLMSLISFLALICGQLVAREK